MFFNWDSIDFRMCLSGFAASSALAADAFASAVSPMRRMDHGHQEKGRRVIGPVELEAIAKPPQSRGRGRASGNPGPDNLGQDLMPGLRSMLASDCPIAVSTLSSANALASSNFLRRAAVGGRGAMR